MTPQELWYFLPRGYLFTIAVETPILLIGLSRSHPVLRRLIAGIWLTACTYPIVVLVLPLLMPRLDWMYLLVAEIFAPVAECALFAAAFHGRGIRRGDQIRDFVTITLANLASFGIGYWLNRHGG